MEKTIEQKEKSETKFKVGDRVRIAYHKSKYYRRKAGVITRVLPAPKDADGVLASTGAYKVKLDCMKTELDNWANDDDLELI